MNEKDEQLIEQANRIDDWGLISNLKDQAESAEAKKALHSRMITLYRKEEAFAGQL